MWIHYDSLTAAFDHLNTNGWRRLKNGAWVSKDGTCRATTHPAGAGKVVVCYTEIERAA